MRQRGLAWCGVRRQDSQVQNLSARRLGFVVGDVDLPTALDQPRDSIKDEAWRKHIHAVYGLERGIYVESKKAPAGGRRFKNPKIAPKYEDRERSSPASFAASHVRNTILGHHLSFTVLLDQTIEPSASMAAVVLCSSSVTPGGGAGSRFWYVPPIIEVPPAWPRFSRRIFVV